MDSALMDEVEGRPPVTVTPPRRQSHAGDDAPAAGVVGGGLQASSGDVWDEVTGGDDSDGDPEAGAAMSVRDSVRSSRSRRQSLTERLSAIELPSFLKRSDGSSRDDRAGARGSKSSGTADSGMLASGGVPGTPSGEYAAVGGFDPDSDSVVGEDLLEGESAGKWAVVSNLDVFLTRLYTYYREGGFGSIVAARVTSLIILAFTTVFSSFIFLFVDWHKLFECDGAETCRNFSTYITTEALSFRDPTTFQLLVYSYFVLFSVYWAISLVSFGQSLAASWNMAAFYKDQLGITTRELQTMQWHEVVARFEKLHKSGTYRVALRHMSAHTIALRIMRRENYMVALVNKDMLDLSLPIPCTPWRVHTPLTKSLEWNLNLTLFNHMFSRDFKLRKSFVNNVGALQRRFILFGILNLLLLPFALMFMTVYFFLKHAEDFHKKGDYLGPRKWSPNAMWRFREFNELPHVFERRVNASYTHANEFQKQFPMPEIAAVARCTAFITGAVVSALLLLTVVDENLLLFIHLGDRNLLWYIAMFSAVLAVSRAFVPTPEDSVFNPDGVMRKLVVYTHFMPRHWRGRCHTYDVRDEFLDLFQFRIVLFLQDIMSVVFTPLLLCFALPLRAARLLEFVRRVSVDVEGVGTVCGYSLFDLSSYGNAKYGAPVHAPKMLRSRQGKMEKSLVSFLSQYPNWEASPEALELLAKLHAFQATESAAAVQADSAVFAAMLAKGGMPPPGAGASWAGGMHLAGGAAATAAGSGDAKVPAAKPNQTDELDVESKLAGMGMGMGVGVGAHGVSPAGGPSPSAMRNALGALQSSPGAGRFTAAGAVPGYPGFYHGGWGAGGGGGIAAPGSAGPGVGGGVGGVDVMGSMRSSAGMLPVASVDSRESGSQFFWLDKFYESQPAPGDGNAQV